MPCQRQKSTLFPYTTLFRSDKENAYFADGVQDDLLTNLSKIGDLKVISRTSVMPYRATQLNAREIGRAHVWTPVIDVSGMPSSVCKNKKNKLIGVLTCQGSE